PAGETTDFDYDKMARHVRTRLPEPGGNEETNQTRPETDLVYDPAGNLTEEKVLTGFAPFVAGTSEYRTIEHQYNERNELVQTVYLASRSSLPSGAPNSLPSGVLNSLESTQPIVSYVYDAVGNLKWQTDPRFGGDKNTPVRSEFTYDALHRQTKM